MDELTQRVRSLDAERTRPDVKPPSVDDLIRLLVATLVRLFDSDMDARAVGKAATRADRVSDFAEWLECGLDIRTAASRVGVSYQTGRRYAAELRKREAS